MKNSTKALVVGAAMAGLFSGSAAVAASTSSARSADPGTSVMADKKDEVAKPHSCKGKNECKGQGGCKTGEGGCKGKNSCKGKGGCSTAKKP